MNLLSELKNIMEDSDNILFENSDNSLNLSENSDFVTDINNGKKKKKSWRQKIGDNRSIIIITMVFIMFILILVYLYMRGRLIFN